MLGWAQCGGRASALSTLSPLPPGPPPPPGQAAGVRMALAMPRSSQPLQMIQGKRPRRLKQEPAPRSYKRPEGSRTPC